MLGALCCPLTERVLSAPLVAQLLGHLKNPWNQKQVIRQSRILRSRPGLSLWQARVLAKGFVLEASGSERRQQHGVILRPICSGTVLTSLWEKPGLLLGSLGMTATRRGGCSRPAQCRTYHDQNTLTVADAESLHAFGSGYFGRLGWLLLRASPCVWFFSEGPRPDARQGLNTIVPRSNGSGGPKLS